MLFENPTPLKISSQETSGNLRGMIILMVMINIIFILITWMGHPEKQLQLTLNMENININQ